MYITSSITLKMNVMFVEIQCYLMLFHGITLKFNVDSMLFNDNSMSFNVYLYIQMYIRVYTDELSIYTVIYQSITLIHFVILLF